MTRPCASVRRQFAQPPSDDIHKTGHGSRSAARLRLRIARGSAKRVATAGMRVVKGRIEAGDLRQVRPSSGDGADGRKIVRLMQRRERRQLIELGKQLGRHALRPVVIGAAMDDAMADRDEPVAAEMALRPADHLSMSASIIGLARASAVRRARHRPDRGR